MKHHLLAALAALCLAAPAEAKLKNYCAAGVTSSSMIKVEVLARRSSMPAKLGGNVARAFVLGARDMPLKLFSVAHGKRSYVVAVPEDASRSCFFFAVFDSVEKRRMWSTDRTGALKDTVVITPKRAYKARNGEHKREFDEVRRFFLDYAAKQ